MRNLLTGRRLTVVAPLLVVGVFAAACEPYAKEAEPPHSCTAPIQYCITYNNLDDKAEIVSMVNNWRVWDGESDVIALGVSTSNDDAEAQAYNTPYTEEQLPPIVEGGAADLGLPGQEFVWRCGDVTCSLYLTVRATRWIADEKSIGVVAALEWIPGWAGRFMQLIAAYILAVDTAARNDGNSLKLRVVHPLLSPFSPALLNAYNYDKGARWCRNDYRTT